MNFIPQLAEIKSLLWLLGLLPIFLYCQFWLHQEIQYLLFFITRRLNFVVVIFSIVFFPGILLHELSHFLTAKLLGVKTGNFSVVPKRLNSQQIRLGFVEIEKTDIFRASIIGVAPLINGCIVVGYIGLVHFDLPILWSAFWNKSFSDILGVAYNTYNTSNFWLWLYLLVVISSAMVPSKSDRRAWIPILLIGIILFGIIWYFGGDSWMKIKLIPIINQGCDSLSAIFFISIAAYLLIMIPLFLIRRIFYPRIIYQSHN